MQGAGGTHRDRAFRVGGVVAVAVLLWWPASAYGSADPGALRTEGRTPASLSADLHAASSPSPAGRSTPAFIEVIPTGAWVWARESVGYPHAHRVTGSDRQEQTALSAAPTLHLSR
jgi:hypothetical protein